MKNVTTIIFRPTISAMLALAVASQTQAVVRFVDPNSPGPPHNGTSWAFAFTSLSSALASAVANDEVWVANGTYKPTTGTDRTISFAIPGDVIVYGGFAGSGVNETSVAQRDILANRVILSGDIGGVGNADNSFHVVTLTGVVSGTQLDGVFITGGHANGGASNNLGAGLRVSGTPVIRNCVVIGNTAAGSGGGMLVTGDASMVNCVIARNTATTGAAIDMQGSHIAVVNCTVVHNANTSSGGSAIRCLNGDAFTTMLNNDILWGNTGVGGTLQSRQVSAFNATISVSHSLVEGLDGTLSGPANIDGEAVFVDANGADNQEGTVDDNYALRSGSAGIDGGNNVLIHSDLGDMDDDGIIAEPIPFDIAYEPRRIEDIVNNNGSGTSPRVDMGAYEFKRPVRVICVNDTANTGANTGVTWQDAYLSLQSAINDAADPKVVGSDIIFVAQGTYKPSVPAGRAATFAMQDDTKIYGGFDDSGTQGSLSQRNPDANRTILSGDIGTAGNNTDNCFHVVTADGSEFFGPTPAALDGFIVTGGNASGSAPDNIGGGLRAFNQSSFDPILRNCKFVGNLATLAGAAVDSVNTDITMVNCVVSGNSALGGSRTMRFGTASTPSMINCTVANNLGGGVTITASVTLNIDNSIFVTNGGTGEGTQLQDAGGTFVVDHSCVQGLTGSLGGTGNIGVVPIFADPNGADNVFGTSDDDYHILACSSVIDAANFNALPTDAEDLDDDGLTTLERLQQDIAYDARAREDAGVPNTGIGAAQLDMGAYEFQDTSGGTCPADCFPIGAPNGQINIDDLLVVINQWGVCLGGNCAGDVSPPCKDQNIDIDDLLSIINAWGNCP